MEIRGASSIRIPADRHHKLIINRLKIQPWPTLTLVRHALHGRHSRFAFHLDLRQRLPASLLTSVVMSN